MHRAAAKVLRTASLCTARGFRASRRGSLSLLSSSSAFNTSFGTSASARSPAFLRPAGARYLSTSPIARSTPYKPPHPSGEPLRSSMFLRRTSIAFVSALVGFGAWYTYNTNPSDGTTRNYTMESSKRAGDLPTRSVLVIGPNDLYTSTIVGEGPISKATNDGRLVVEMLSPQQANNKLREMEESYHVQRGRGVVRYDVTQLPSNNPIEDDHIEKIIEIPAGTYGSNAANDWMFWGVFDGHGGWATSAKLRQTLVTWVGQSLDSAHHRAADDNREPKPSEIHHAISTAFTRLDDEIVLKAAEKVLKTQDKMLAAEILAPAISGSCALLAFYDSNKNILHVANTGDSRAVLGHMSKPGKWTATPLSEDQTGRNPQEVQRVRVEHPGEEPIRNGRVLGGLEPTRAFGDASYKWSREFAEKLSPNFFGRAPRPLLKTPPYVTAAPEITTTTISPERGDFVVLATDGLWEMLSNDEVVGLVGKWLEKYGPNANKSTPQMEKIWLNFVGPRGELPLDKDLPAGERIDTDSQKSPEDELRRRGLSPDKQRFVVEDNNAATHLVRNALGGKKQEQVSALLTLPYPTSRRFRDDLTVQVIFFGNRGPVTGEVTVNQEATAASRVPTKPKVQTATPGLGQGSNPKL